VPVPLIDFVETVSAPFDVGIEVAADALSDELLLPPHAAKPMATSATAVTVSTGARLSFISDPLLRLGPNLASTTSPPATGIV
jgi:hypothetical protein